MCVCGTAEPWFPLLLAGLHPAGLAPRRLLHLVLQLLFPHLPLVPESPGSQQLRLGSLGSWGNGHWCPVCSLAHGLPQLEIQTCSHISLGAGFGSIILPVLAEEMPFSWLPGELVAVSALLSSLLACAQLLPLLPLPSIQLWLLSFQVPLGY